MKKFRPDPIIAIVLKKLRARSRQLTYKKIEEDTGLSYDWLAKFAAGSITDPSYTKIKILSDYFSNN
jgi:transcriptional regulator with XRE-family HTH domain